MKDEERWMQLRWAVEAQMAHRGLSQGDVVKVAGLSRETVRPVLAGVAGNYRASTLSKVSLALQWPGDRISRILDGSYDPTEDTEEATVRGWLRQFSPRLIGILGSDDPPSALQDMAREEGTTGLETEVAALSAILVTLERMMQEINQAASVVNERS